MIPASHMLLLIQFVHVVTIHWPSKPLRLLLQNVHVQIMEMVSEVFIDNFSGLCHSFHWKESSVKDVSFVSKWRVTSYWNVGKRNVCFCNSFGSVKTACKDMAAPIPGDWNCPWPSPNWVLYGEPGNRIIRLHWHTCETEFSQQQSLLAPCIPGLRRTVLAPSIHNCLSVQGLYARCPVRPALQRGGRLSKTPPALQNAQWSMALF